VGSGVGDGGGGADGRVGDQAVVGVRQILDLEDGLRLVCFEADLAAIRPDTFYTWVVSQRAEHGVVGGSEIFEDVVSVSNAMGGEVGVFGQGIFLMLEDEIACEL
jgi:hypothetical protein